MDDHVGDFYVHLFCVLDLSGIKIGDFLLEDSLHFVHTWVLPDLYQSVVDLFNVYLSNYIICLQSTETTCLGLVSIELFSMRWGICYMEDIAKDRGAWDCCPVEILRGDHQTVMDCFGLVAPATCG